MHITNIKYKQNKATILLELIACLLACLLASQEQASYKAFII
jgi:hypothetical protein